MKSPAPSQLGSNSLLPPRNLAAPPVSVHIFSPLPQPPAELGGLLQQACIPYRPHQQHGQLQILLAERDPSSKTVVLVELPPQQKSSNYSDLLFPKDYKFPCNIPNLALRFYCLSRTHDGALQGCKQAAEFCQRYLGRGGRPHRVQLRSVQSLHCSRSKRLAVSRSPEPLKTGSHLSYQMLFYQAVSPGQFGPYEELLRRLEAVKNSICFSTFQELAGSIRGRNQKYLLLTNGQAVAQLLGQLKKNCMTHFQILVLGQLSPSALFLDPAVLLATDDPLQITHYLQTQGFETTPLPEEPKLSPRHSMSSTDFRNIMNKIMKEDSEMTSSNNVFRSTFRSGVGLDSKTVRHWKVDRDSRDPSHFITTETIDSSPSMLDFSEKMKGRKFKRKEVEEGEESEETGEMYQPLLQTITKEQSSPFGGRASKVSDKGKQAGSEGDPATSTSQLEAGFSLPIQPMLFYDQQKRAYPSNVIHETSEEYRGSNNTSTVNADPSLHSRTTRQQISLFNQSPGSHRFSREDEASRGREDEASRGREDETLRATTFSGYYASSHQSFKSSDKLNQDTRGNSSNSLRPSQELQIDEVVYKQDSGEGGFTKISSIVNKSPLKVVRKAVISSPEEIRYPSPVDMKQSETAQMKQSSPSQHVPPQRVPRQIQTVSNSDNPSTAHSRSKLHDHQPSRWKESSAVVRIAQRGHTDHFSPAVPARLTHGIPPLPHYGTSPLPHYGTPPLPHSQEKMIPPSLQKSFQKQFDGYERVEKDGVVIYQRRISNNSKQQPRVVHLSPWQPLSHTSIERKEANSTSGRSEEASKIAPLYFRPSLHQPADGSRLSRLSEVHSEGSMLQRNNIRFGVKAPKKEDEAAPSMLLQESNIKRRELKGTGSKSEKGKGSKSETGTGTGKGSEKGTLGRTIRGEKALAQERLNLRHIDTRLNNFHFIFHEELRYLGPMLQTQLTTPQDQLDSFTSLENMLECIRAETRGQFEAGFIFTLPQHMSLINPKVLPEDYYLVVIDNERGPLLEIDPETKQVRINDMGQLVLAQQLILSNKLQQYVAYSSHRPDLALLADRFKGTAFILDEVQEFTSELLDFYYCESPRLTRLYLLCSKESIQELLRLLKVYLEVNPAFNPLSVKLICLLSSILPNEELIIEHPSVTFINNPEDLAKHTDILRYVHHSQPARSPFLPHHFFLPLAYISLESSLHAAFPGRFRTSPYSKLSEVYSTLQGKGKVKQESYLLLGDSLAGERVATDAFVRVYMLGKSQSLQPSILRVLNLEELVQQLSL